MAQPETVPLPPGALGPQDWGVQQAAAAGTVVPAQVPPPPQPHVTPRPPPGLRASGWLGIARLQDEDMNGDNTGPLDQYVNNPVMTEYHSPHGYMINTHVDDQDPNTSGDSSHDPWFGQRLPRARAVAKATAEALWSGYRRLTPGDSSQRANSPDVSLLLPPAFHDQDPTPTDLLNPQGTVVPEAAVPPVSTPPPHTARVSPGGGSSFLNWRPPPDFRPHGQNTPTQSPTQNVLGTHVNPGTTVPQPSAPRTPLDPSTAVGGHGSGFFGTPHLRNANGERIMTNVQGTILNNLGVVADTHVNQMRPSTRTFGGGYVDAGNTPTERPRTGTSPTRIQHSTHGAPTFGAQSSNPLRADSFRDFYRDWEFTQTTQDPRSAMFGFGTPVIEGRFGKGGGRGQRERARRGERLETATQLQNLMLRQRQPEENRPLTNAVPQLPRVATERWASEGTAVPIGPPSVFARSLGNSDVPTAHDPVNRMINCVARMNQLRVQNAATRRDEMVAQTMNHGLVNQWAPLDRDANSSTSSIHTGEFETIHLPDTDRPGTVVPGSSSDLPFAVPAPPTRRIPRNDRTTLVIDGSNPRDIRSYNEVDLFGPETDDEMPELEPVPDLDQEYRENRPIPPHLQPRYTGDHTECAICLQQFIHGERLCRLQCRHS